LSAAAAKAYGVKLPPAAKAGKTGNAAAVCFATVGEAGALKLWRSDTGNCVATLTPDERADNPGAALGDNSALQSLQLLRGSGSGDGEGEVSVPSSEWPFGTPRTVSRVNSGQRFNTGFDRGSPY